MKLETKLKKWTLSHWKKELDKIFSQRIRRQYAKNGKAKCYTCGVVRLIEEMDAGHFNPRQYLSTRFDDRNVKVQCTSCNRYNNGQPAIFAQNLIEEYGNGIIKELQKDNFKPVKLDKHWYVKKIKEEEEFLSKM